MNALSQIAPFLLASAGLEPSEAEAAVRLFAHPHTLLWLIPLFPAVGFLINAFFGIRLQRALGKPAVHVVAVGAMILSWVVALVCAVQMVSAPAEARLFHQLLWTVLDVGRGFRLDLAFALDPLSLMMVLIITTIARSSTSTPSGTWRDPAYCASSPT